MNKKIKAMWVRALRSGKYKQGKAGLCRKTPHGKRFCCLGVLCDLHAKKFPKNKWLFTEHLFMAYSSSGNTVVLPRNVQKWAGLKESNPSIGDDTLVGLNDDGNTFKEIAAIISKNL